MVNITEVRVPPVQSNNRQRNNQNFTLPNGNPNTNNAAVPRSKQQQVRNKPASHINDDDEDDELQGAHKFEKAYLIMTLAAWVKKPNIEQGLSEVLAEYRAAFNANGKPNFVEASLIIQEAGKLYEKKVDLLFKNILEAELRIVRSFDIINIEELHNIEKKMRKRKLTQVPGHQLPKSKRRKKSHKWLQNPWLGQLIGKVHQIFQEHQLDESKDSDSLPDLFNIEPDVLKPMKETLTEVKAANGADALKAWEERYYKDYEARFIPLKEYIYIPNLEQSKFIAYESPDNDQIVRWETLLMADHNFYFDKKFKWYEVYYNNKDPNTMMDTSVWDDAWYKHRMAHLEAPTLLELFINYDKYDDTIAETFLMEKLEHEYKARLAAETLKEKSKRLCPYQLNVVATPIPAIDLHILLERQRLQFIPESVTTESDTEEFANENEETVTVLVISDPNNSNTENQIMILPQTPEEVNEMQQNVPALPEGSNSDICLASATVNIESNHAQEDQEVPAAENNETVVEEIGIDGLETKNARAVLTDVSIDRRKSQRERKVKKPETDDEDQDTEIEPKHKKRFKLQVTTTVNFADYERFFCSNYAAETREGIVFPLPPAEVAPLPPSEVVTLPPTEIVTLPPTEIVTLPPADESVADDLNTDELHVEPAAEEEDAPQAHIPRLPTEEIITPSMRRFDELQAVIAQNLEKQRWYYEWETMIRARLQEQQQGPQFDIHQYGTRIVNQFPENEPGKFIKLKELVVNQPKREVVRNFVAALHLATSMNLEVSGTTPGTLCNDTLEFKLLSRELHHETLLEFEAPSELKGNRGKKGKGKRQHAASGSFVVEEIEDRSLSEPMAKKSKFRKSQTKQVHLNNNNNETSNRNLPKVLLSNLTPDMISQITANLSNDARIARSNPPVILNHSLPSINNLERTTDFSSSSNSEYILSETINNTLINMQSSTPSPPSPVQSQTAKTPAKSVTFSQLDRDVVRGTTTIVKTPSSFALTQPAATSTPDSLRQSFDSGISIDGYSTSGESSPRTKARRLTIDEAMCDVDMLMAGPSTDYSMNYPASFDMSGDVYTPVSKGKGDREGCNGRKRHLDFEMM